MPTVRLPRPCIIDVRSKTAAFDLKHLIEEKLSYFNTPFIDSRVGRAGGKSEEVMLRSLPTMVQKILISDSIQ